MNRAFMPRAITRGLIVTPRAGELMIFDLARHLSHRLGRLAARVWKLSDGSRTVDQIARVINGGVRDGESQAQILAVLQQLRRARLLDGVAPADLARRRGTPNNGHGEGGMLNQAQFVWTIDCDVRRRARRASTARRGRRNQRSPG